MLGGFDPRSEKLFFQRRYRDASMAALLAFAAFCVWVATQQRADDTIDVELQPDIEDFAVQEDEPEPEEEPPKPAPEKPKAKPAGEPIDPTKPIDRPEKATMPKPDGGNKPPGYPESLRDAGITGEVVVKLHIHRDGTVKGAKILRKKSSATTEEEKTAAEKAFVAAVIAAVRTWKYEPAKLDGEPISIWFPVTLPFTLTGG